MYISYLTLKGACVGQRTLWSLPFENSLDLRAIGCAAWPDEAMIKCVSRREPFRFIPRLKMRPDVNRPFRLRSSTVLVGRVSLLPETVLNAAAPRVRAAKSLTCIRESWVPSSRY